MLHKLLQDSRGVMSAASFPEGGGARAQAATTSAVDDLLGLENEISAIQVGQDLQNSFQIFAFYFKMFHFFI